MVADAQLIDRLKVGNGCAYGQLYKLYYPSIEKHILSNSGNKADAEDIFQETVLILNENIQKHDFALTSSLKTYLFSISRNLWLKVLNSRKNTSSLSHENSFYDLKDASEDERENQKNVSTFVERLINKIPLHCQQIIDFVFYRNASPQQVAKELGYNNNHTVSNAKYKCIQHMKQISDKRELVS